MTGAACTSSVVGTMAKTVSERLLDAGLKLFANRGYAGTSVQEIIDEAGVAKPTLYYYFENKAGLFQALVDRALDERLRLMRQAAPPGKETVEQLVDIIVAVSELAGRKPDHLRLCFAIAFAAPGEFPAACKRHDKMIETYLFLREIVTLGLKRGVLDASFTIDELTQSYFHLVQHSTAMSTFEAKMRKGGPPLPPRMTPRRIVDLFTGGAGGRKTSARNGAAPKRRPVLAHVAIILAALGLSTTALPADPPPNGVPATNYPAADVAPIPVMSDATNAAPAASPTTNAPPDLADLRAVPEAVRASHPELALVSPIADNARDPMAIDLETCFRLTAVRDDSLKISVQDIRIAQAQMTESIAGLWPTFTATKPAGIHPLHQSGHWRLQHREQLGALPGLRNYTSGSHVTMNYTILDGGQNWNKVGAASAAIAAKRQTLARDYQTIYQDVAQAFYNVLEFQGDLVIQRDLVQGLAARVDDLKGRVSLGRSRPSELLQAQTDLANARVTIQSDIGSDNAARETLAFYNRHPRAAAEAEGHTQKFPHRCRTRIPISPTASTGPTSFRNWRACVRRSEIFPWPGASFSPTVSAQGDYLASQDPVLQQHRRDHGAANLDADLRRRPHSRADPREPRIGPAKRAQRGAIETHRRPGHPHGLRQLQRQRGAGRRAARGGRAGGAQSRGAGG